MEESAEERQGPTESRARPAPKPPLLVSLNGIGLRMVGQRAFERETASYIKTRFVTLVFVPVLALDAWRVQDADGGWYFVARERLSRFDRNLNALVLLGVALVLGTAAWRAHFGSPEYLARQQLARADALRAEGKLGDATGLYVELVEASTPERRSAEQRLAELPDELAAATPAEAARALEALLGAREVEAEPFLEAGLASAEHARTTRPDEAFALLERALRLLPLDAPVERPATLLSAFRTARPEDPRPASLLAELWERSGDLARAEAELAPLAERLGTLEGARILGQLYLAEDRLEESQRLLEGYVAARLPDLRTAREEFERRLAHSQDEAFARLDEDRAFRRAWEAAPESRREALVEERITAHLRADRALARAQAEFERASSVVPAALALGVAQLRRAQGARGEERARGLAAAEKTFLAVRGDAGEEAEFQFFLGQVYYWLGRAEEGHALLEQYLTSEERSSTALTTVAGVLREVGLASEARTLAEEAYSVGTDEAEREEAASLRYVLGIDAQDRLVWLERCSASDPYFRASRAYERGLEALAGGRRGEAKSQLGEAVELLSGLPTSSSALNNAALAQRSLATLLGTPEAHEKALELFERSLALEPTSTIGLWNTAEACLAKCAFDLTHAALDHARLMVTPELAQLEFLYDDEAGQRALLERLSTHASLRRGLELLARHTTLAPQELSSYQTRLGLAWRLRDEAALARLEQESAGLDVEAAEGHEQIRRYYAGEEWALAERQAAVARLEALLAELTPTEGATPALAACELVAALEGLAPTRAPAETDEERLVALSEAAFHAAPSRATRSGWSAALARRAVLRLAGAHPELAELVAHTRRSTAPEELLPFALDASGPLADAAARDADVVRLLELEREGARRFPADARPYTWALLRVLDPALAAEVGERIGADAFAGRARRLATRLSPLHSGWALELHWQLVLAGEENAARELLAEFERRGVPMPKRL